MVYRDISTSMQTNFSPEPDHVKRPMNAFLLWANPRRKELAEKNPHTHNSVLSKILGEEWRALSCTEKKPYIEKAKEIREKHRVDHPDYVYRPKKKNHNHGQYSQWARCISQRLSYARRPGHGVGMVGYSGHIPAHVPVPPLERCVPSHVPAASSHVHASGGMWYGYVHTSESDMSCVSSGSPPQASVSSSSSTSNSSTSSSTIPAVVRGADTITFPTAAAMSSPLCSTRQPLQVIASAHDKATQTARKANYVIAEVVSGASSSSSLQLPLSCPTVQAGSKQPSSKKPLTTSVAVMAGKRSGKKSGTVVIKTGHLATGLKTSESTEAVSHQATATVEVFSGSMANKRNSKTTCSEPFMLSVRGSYNISSDL